MVFNRPGEALLRPVSRLPGFRNASKPPAVFPGGIATDSDLLIGQNRIVTALVNGIGATDTMITVADPGLIRQDMVLSLGRDGEIVKITGGSGQSFSVLRGFDGTTAVAHAVGAPVLGNIIAWHHNALVSEIEAIEAALGVHLGNVSPMHTPRDWCRTPGGSLTPGTQSITLSPVPVGVNGSNRRHYLWISGGSGSPEAVRIQGGTAISGAASGTVVINCVYAH